LDKTIGLPLPATIGESLCTFYSSGLLTDGVGFAAMLANA
jgi:hypothetical protein